MTAFRRRAQNNDMKNTLFLLLVILSAPALLADDALSQCRQIEDLEKRVSCYDDVVDSRDLVETAERDAAGAPPSTMARDTVPDAQSLFGTNDAEARQIVETTLAIEQIDQIEATVADVRQSVGEKLIVTLGNGQVWRQLDSKPLHLKSGDGVVVRKASFGSFLLALESSLR